MSEIVKKKKGRGRPFGKGPYGTATKAIRVPVDMVDEIKNFAKNRNNPIPLYDMKVEAGTPNITDSEDYKLYNLNQNIIITDPNNYFLVKVSGYSMKNAGIIPDDMLLVDRKKEAKDGDIIVASINDGAVVKRLSQKDGITKLISENDDYDNIEDQTLNLHLWGVVTRVIRDY